MLTLIKKETAKVRDQDQDRSFTGNLESTQIGYLKEKCLVGYFDGPHRFMDYLDTSMPTPKQSESSAKGAGDDGDFNAFKSYEKAMDTFKNNPKSLLGFTENDVALRDQFNAGIGVEYDTNGDYVDVGRFLEGEPECFGRMIDGNPRGRRVNLMINTSWGCWVKPASITERSKRIQRLVDWLENQQVRTSILAVESTHCAHIEILVKNHDDILDMRDIAVISHPEFLRRLIFRFDEYSPTWSHGYGSPRDFSSWMKDHPPLPELDSEISIFIDNNSKVDRMNTQFDKLEKWLATQIHEVGTAPEERFRTVNTGDE
jgi:hypothetical protein